MSKPKKTALERGVFPGDLGKAHRWKPGQSGNPGGLPGRPKTKTLTDLASEMIEEKASDPLEREKLKAALWKMCLSDKVAASMTLRLLWERLEGKPKEEIDLTITTNMRQVVERARERAELAIEERAAPALPPEPQE
jgi:hypothetical protein